MTDWQVLIPVRGGPHSKSRLARTIARVEDRMALSDAFALDVVTAALTTVGEGRVSVVTGDERLGGLLNAAGARIIPDPPQPGLNSAVQSASTWLQDAFPDDGIAVLMGDIPGITPESLSEALEAAESVPLGVLADEEGTGTTVLTASTGASLTPSYGEGSFARHRRAGHTPLAVPKDSPLRRDIDTPDDLLSPSLSGSGPHTREVLSRICGRLNH